MDHETATSLLSELVTGELGEDLTAELRVHVETCAECRELLRTLQLVHEEVSAHGPALFQEHPSSEDLVRFSTADEELPLERMVEIGAHVRACPTCRLEAETAGLALSATDAGWRRAVRALSPRARGNPWRAWAPALAALLLLTLYPAYLGMVALPNLKSKMEQGGSFGFLYLPKPSRGTPAAPPEIGVQPGQMFQPVLVEFPRAEAESEDSGIEILLVRTEGGAVVWRYGGRVRDLVDPEEETLNLLIPASTLESGEYRLEIRDPDRESPIRVASFRVIAPEGTR